MDTREPMDTSKAAAVLGRRGGQAGTGEAKRRGDAAHYRAIRAKRPAPQVYECKGEWGGYTVREGLRGWIVETWSATAGERTGVRTLVPYDTFPRSLRLDGPQGPWSTIAQAILEMSRNPTMRVLRRGHIVR